MVQTVCSYKILAGKKRIVLEKPHSLRRIFFSIHRIADQISWHPTEISFDDPSFFSYYVLDGQFKHFEVKGDDISQGDIWVRNVSNANLLYTVSEILI